MKRAPNTLSACTADACQQGRAPCPCPQACRVPAEQDPAASRWALATTSAATPAAHRVAVGLLAHMVFTAACAALVCVLVVFGASA